MAKHRSHSVEFKRQVAQEFLAGEPLHALSKRHDICRNLIRVWVAKYEAGDFDADVEAANLIQSPFGNSAQWEMRRRRMPPMARWIMASETSRRAS
jgi:transposase-like protein